MQLIRISAQSHIWNSPQSNPGTRRVNFLLMESSYLSQSSAGGRQRAGTAKAELHVSGEAPAAAESCRPHSPELETEAEPERIRGAGAEKGIGYQAGGPAPRRPGRGAPYRCQANPIGARNFAAAAAQDGWAK